MTTFRKEKMLLPSRKINRVCNMIPALDISALKEEMLYNEDGYNNDDNYNDQFN